MIIDLSSDGSSSDSARAEPECLLGPMVDAKQQAEIATRSRRRRQSRTTPWLRNIPSVGQHNGDDARGLTKAVIEGLVELEHVERPSPTNGVARKANMMMLAPGLRVEFADHEEQHRYITSVDPTRACAVLSLGRPGDAPQ
jgi:hypothetical protein